MYAEITLEISAVVHMIIIVCRYSEVTLPVAVSVKNRRLNRSVIPENIVPPEHSIGILSYDDYNYTLPYYTYEACIKCNAKPIMANTKL